MQARQIAATLLVVAGFVPPGPQGPHGQRPLDRTSRSAHAQVHHADERTGTARLPPAMPGVTTGLNWSGYLADAGADSAAYTAVSGEFTQPRINATTCLRSRT